MQTLNIQFASANTASEKSTAGKKSPKSSASFESVLKSVSEGSKAKKAELVQSEEKSSVKKLPETSESKKVSKKEPAKKVVAENSAVDTNIEREVLNESNVSNAASQGAQASMQEALPEKTNAQEIKEENTIEVVFDLGKVQSIDEQSISTQASTLVQVQPDVQKDGSESPVLQEAGEAVPLAVDSLLLDGGVENPSLEQESTLNAEAELPLATNQGAVEDTDAKSFAQEIQKSSKDLLEEKKDSASSKESASLQSDRPSNSVFTIIDERTAVENTEDDLTLKEDSLKAVSAKDTEVQAVNADAVHFQAQQNILSTSSQSAGATGSNFQAMLSQQIQENAPEFVKAGSIVLRDNNSGTINMTMKPESLGNVKISLEVSDKVIAGQITVHSQEAYDAFKQNLDTLKQAFQQNGFDSAGFTLNLAQNGSGNNGAFAQEQQNMAQEFMSNKTYGQLASTGESSVQEAEGAASYSKSSLYQIDVVA